MLEFAVPKVVVLRRRNSIFPKNIETSCNIPWPAAALAVSPDRYLQKKCVFRVHETHFFFEAGAHEGAKGGFAAGV